MKYKLQDSEFELPEGYTLKEGCKFSEDLKRYLWCPKPKDLFFAPFVNKIYEYIEWSTRPDKTKIYLCSIDGYGKIKEIGKKRGFWCFNLDIRKNAIPIQYIK